MAAPSAQALKTPSPANPGAAGAGARPPRGSRSHLCRLRSLGCPCGGGCPRCTAPSRGSSAHADPHEAEAHGAWQLARVRSDRALERPATQLPAPHAGARGDHSQPHGRRYSPVPPARGPPAASGPAIRPTAAPPGASAAGVGLTPAERERFEPLLGLDLSAVRVHADPPAASLAAAQRSHAFAYGNHVVLGSRAQHAPADVRAHVLAHELVHVGQQAGPRRSFDPGFSQPARGPPALRPAPVAVQRLDEDDDSILPAWVSEAAGTVADVGAEAFETATELPGRATRVRRRERRRRRRDARPRSPRAAARRGRRADRRPLLRGPRHARRAAISPRSASSTSCRRSSRPSRD